MGSSASKGSAQLLLLLLLFACLHLSRAQSPTASPPAPDEDASPTTPDAGASPPAPAPAPVENAFPPAVSPAAVGSPFSFTFDFSKASTSHVKDLKFEGDAAPHLHPDLIDATCDSFGDNPIGCVGRVSYAYPVPFYDDLTNEVASFQTSFTFSIKGTTKENIKGDGMAFFIAYYPSAMPLNSGGGYLGLMDGNTKTAFGAQQFVAVEFDTYMNQWDTDSKDHIGIDINSVLSVNTTPLDSFGLNGYMTATVAFNSTTRMLVADLQFNDAKNNRLPVQVSRQLPDQLNNLLPAQAAVGFSAATGTGAELHQILSWSFSSSLASPHKGFN